jgi:lipid-binding SYLF domain-containing protein
MRNLRMAAIAVVVLTSFGAAATPAQVTREVLIVEDSIAMIQGMLRDPRVGVPPALLREAQGVILFPNLLRGGFLGGVRHGRGIVLVRGADGRWSNPFFIRLTGGSFGLQAGIEAAEMLLVFRDRRTIDRFLLGLDKLTFGADASVAAGPVGSGVGANTDPQLRADILVYCRGRGLFAGATIGGSVARVDHRADWAFYGVDAMPDEIIANVEGLRVPASVARLQQILDVPAMTDPRRPPREDAPHLEPIDPLPGVGDDGAFD